MKIQKIHNETIKFRQDGQVNVGKAVQEPFQKDLPQISVLPSQFVTAQTPVGYAKLGEFEIFEGKKTHVYKLSNGQMVVLTPTKGETKINTVVRCGSANEPDNLRGISHFIEHNLFNGTKKFSREDIDKKTNEIGAYSNAATSYDYTNYYFSANINDEKDLQKMVELHADMLQNPTFDKSMLDKERQIVNSEIGRISDYDGNEAYNKAIKQLFQIKSTSKDIVIGTVDNINSITRDDVVSYYNKNYTPDKMTTVLTGDFEPEKAIELISKYFTKPLTATQTQNQHLDLNPIEKSVRSDFYNSKTDSSKFYLMMKGPQNKDLKENLCVELILNMLNLKYSKLNENMKKFNGKVYCGLERLDNSPNSLKFININGSCSEKDTEAVLKSVYADIFGFPNENIKDNLELVKKQTKKSYLVAGEEGGYINDYMISRLRDYSPEEIKNIREIEKSITEEDIKNTFKKYFDLNKVSISVAHPTQKAGNVAFKGKLQNTGLDLKEFKYAKLPNNSDVYLKEDNSDLKSFVMTVTSPLPANINPMLCSVLNKMLSKGTVYESENDYNKTLDKNSTDLSIVANSYGFEVMGSALKEDINFALNKVIDVLCTPKLTQQEFEKAKEQIAQELQGTEKSSFDFTNEVMFPQVKSASTIEDKKKALNDLKLTDILGFFEYVKQNAQNRFIWNKGEVPYELQKLGTFKPSNNVEFLSYSPLESNVLKIQTDNKQQASISQTFKMQQGKTPEEQAHIYLMTAILGSMHNSRLFADLRETQKLAYHTGTFSEKVGNTRLISLEIETSTDNPDDKNATSANIQKSLDGFKKHIEKMKTEYVTQEELETAKKTCKSRILNSMLTNFDKMGVFLNNLEKGSPDFKNKVLEAIDKATPQDIQNIAQKAFAGNSLVSIVASEKTLKELNLIK